MGDTPSFDDRFARRPAPGGKGFAPAQDHFRKNAPKPATDPFRSSGKPPKLVKPAEPPKAAARSFRSAPFMAKPKLPEPTPKPPARPAMTKPMKDPFARAPLHPPNTRTPPPALPTEPAARTTAARMAPIAAAASFYNPFGRSAPPRGEKTPAHVESPRTPLHVVQATQAQPAAPLKETFARSRPAARSSSLVLVSGASAVAAVETLEAPPPPAVEKTPEPPAADPAPASPVTRKRAGGGGTGGGPPRAAASVAAPVRRGFNQDDLFGIVFGIAVILFLLLWMWRGRSEETPAEDGLVGVQSAANQQLMAAPPPAPLVDPFGNAPVDLRPSGPIPEPQPEPDAAIASATPPPASAPATPPAAAAPAAPIVSPNPQVTAPASPTQAAVAPAAPIAERKMNGWFCTASSKLTKASRAALETELTTFADVFAGKELVVRGYADTRGSIEYNSLLGGERAKVVADFLRTKGLTVAEYAGVGELDGLDDNQNCPNQRRVDVWVKGGPAAAPSRECAPEPEAASLVCG